MGGGSHRSRFDALKVPFFIENKASRAVQVRRSRRCLCPGIDFSENQLESIPGVFTETAFLPSIYPKLSIKEILRFSLHFHYIWGFNILQVLIFQKVFFDRRVRISAEIICKVVDTIRR